jgi:hypothetical protein
LPTRPLYTYGEKRAALVVLIVFFALGSVILLSFNFYGGEIAFQPWGWLAIPAGAASAAVILIGERALYRRHRICFGCGSPVPTGSTTCRVCGRPFPELRIRRLATPPVTPQAPRGTVGTVVRRHDLVMSRIRRFRQLPRSYRILVTFFGVVDVVVLVVVALGLRSWLHAGESILLTFFFVMVLYPFYAPSDPRNCPLIRGRRSSGGVRIAAGVVFLFFGGWAAIGAVREIIEGPPAENVLEGIVFIMGLIGLGGLFVWSGGKRLRVPPPAPHV